MEKPESTVKGTSGSQREGKQIQDIAKRRRSRKRELVNDSRPKTTSKLPDNSTHKTDLRQARILRENKTTGKRCLNRRYGMVVEEFVIDLEDIIRDIQQGKVTLESLPQLGLFPLHEAVARGAVKTAKKLIDLGVKVTTETPDGLTPLEIAVMAGNFDAAALLIKHGAPIDRIRDGIPQIVK